ncbi:MAG: hydrogenase maturation protease [Bacteroidales bacterium]
MKRRYLIGVGNETMTDDGIGPRLAEALRAEAAERGFETVVIGHDTVGVLSYFDDNTEQIVFVDCALMGRTPGEWATFSPDDVETQKPTKAISTHESDLLRIIHLARQLGLAAPPIAILGIEPERVDPGLALSATLQARFDEYLAAARPLLAK